MKEELAKSLEIYAIRELLWDMLEYCGAFRSLSTRDSFEMAILSGRRDVGLWLMSEIENANEDVLLMMKREAKDRQKLAEKDTKDTEDTESDV